MSDRDRTIGAAAETVIALVMLIAGYLLTRVDSLALFGVLLIVFGVSALLHAVAVGLGLISYPAPRDTEDHDER
jgi:hypothetical protein